MSRLSLSRSDALITRVVWRGRAYDVRADCRTVLRLLRLLDDCQHDVNRARTLVARLFFVNELPDDVLGAVQTFLADCEPAPEQPTEPVGDAVGFCYEFDADEIYASFRQVYGLDLLSDRPPHWAVFRTLLEQLPDDCAFKRKLALRGLDTSALSGDRRAKAEAAKQAVQLPERLTAEQRRERAAFEALWDSAG